MDVVIKETKDFTAIEIIALYEDAGWSTYTADIGKLLAAIGNSSLVLGAWVNHELVGLIRILTDGHVIVYVQDILVKERFKRKGIGSLLLARAFESAGDVRQIVVLTDDNPETRGFYEKHGFMSCDRGDLVSFVQMQG